MRNLTIEDLAYLFAADWTIAEVEAATEQELSTGVGIARMLVEMEQDELAGFPTIESLLEYQRTHEAGYKAQLQDRDSSDEPF